MDSVECCLLISVTTGKQLLQKLGMRKLFFLLLAAAGFFLFIGGLHLFSAGAIAPATIVFIAGGVAVYWGSRWDQQREKTEEQKQHERVSRQIASLTKKPWSSHQVLRIEASAGFYNITIFVISFFVVYPIMTLFHDLKNFPQAQWDVLEGAFILFLMLFGGGLLVQLIPFIGKPLAELTTQGIKTWYGMISWSDIEGILLVRLPRGGYNLVFKVNEYLKKGHFHWTRRKNLFGFFSLKFFPRKMIHVPLLLCREPPEVIEALSRFLWVQAMGRSHRWIPIGSEVSNEEKLVQEIHALYRPDDSEAFINFANEESQRIGQMNHGLETSETMNEEELVQEIYALYKSGDPKAVEFARMANKRLQVIEQTMHDRITLTRLLEREFKKTMWKLCATVFLWGILVLIYFKYFK